MRLFAIALMCCGCGASTADNAKTSGNYAAQLGACVATSATKPESVACRCRVNMAWHRPCTPALDVDGGAS